MLDMFLCTDLIAGSIDFISSVPALI